MTSKEPVSALIESLSHDGRGVTHINGKTIFLEGALPGENVLFQYTRRRNHFDEGQTIEVLNPATERRDPICQHFGVCGGCSLQYIENAAQLQYKQQAFQDLLWRQAKIAPQEWLPPLQGLSWGYRRKARLGVKYVFKKNRVIVGFRERKGRLITDSQLCEVLIPEIGKNIAAFATMIGHLSIRDKIPQLEIAGGDNAVSIIIRHLEEFTPQDLSYITEFAINHHLRIYLQPHGIESIHCLYPSDGELLCYYLPDQNLKLEFQPWQFIQINSMVNRAMVNQALKLLDCQPTDRILDLFCGIGNFSLPIAKQGCYVVGAEGDQGAVQQAQHNAYLNGLSQLEFHCTDLFQPISANWSKQSYHKILLDPPRTGAENIARVITQWSPERIVYVACDLATLARDAALLNQSGYILSQAGIMDMFPHTQHVEAMALFIATGR